MIRAAIAMNAVSPANMVKNPIMSKAKSWGVLTFLNIISIVVSDYFPHYGLELVAFKPDFLGFGNRNGLQFFVLLWGQSGFDCFAKAGPQMPYVNSHEVFVKFRNVSHKGMSFG